MPDDSGVARGVKGVPPLIKCWCLRKVQICNKINTLVGNFEIARATAIFYLKRVYLYIR